MVAESLVRVAMGTKVTACFALLSVLSWPLLPCPFDSRFERAHQKVHLGFGHLQEPACEQQLSGAPSGRGVPQRTHMRACARGWGHAYPCGRYCKPAVLWVLTRREHRHTHTGRGSQSLTHLVVEGHAHLTTASEPRARVPSPA